MPEQPRRASKYKPETQWIDDLTQVILASFNARIRVETNAFIVVEFWLTSNEFLGRIKPVLDGINRQTGRTHAAYGYRRTGQSNAVGHIYQYVVLITMPSGSLVVAHELLSAEERDFLMGDLHTDEEILRAAHILREM